MKSKNLPKSINLESHVDDRGIFIPFLSSLEKLPFSSLPAKRNYLVYNFGKGVIRGFHLHKKEWKYFLIINGAAKFIAINPKKTKEKFVFIGSEKNPLLIVIPPGYANGWVSLEEKTILLCCSTSSLEESLKDDIRINPLKWGDLWKVKAR
jgi:dTDP-4-dehydrorhamnose 3,5-epimerase-like enzyme